MIAHDLFPRFFTKFSVGLNQFFFQLPPKKANKFDFRFFREQSNNIVQKVIHEFKFLSINHEVDVSIYDDFNITKFCFKYLAYNMNYDEIIS